MNKKLQTVQKLTKIKQGQYDNEKNNNQDGYAGLFGVNVTKLQIIIE